VRRDPAIKGCVAIKGLSLHQRILTNQRAMHGEGRISLRWRSTMRGDRRACSLSLSPMQSKGVSLSMSIDRDPNQSKGVHRVHTCTPAIWTPLPRAGEKPIKLCYLSPIQDRTRRRQTRKGDVSLSTSLKNTSEPGITLKTITTLVPNNHAVRMQ
jgi:hypothetical protein